jgi:PAS domain S-box-containing protein
VSDIGSPHTPLPASALCDAATATGAGCASREEGLRLIEERYKTIVRAALDAFWVTDEHGRLLEVNDVYCRMSGYTAGELLGKRVSDLDASESSELSDHIRAVTQCGGDRFRAIHRRKDGTLLHLEVSIQHLAATNEYFAFLRDVTEVRRAEEELAQSHALLVNLARLVPGVIYQYRLWPDGRSAFPYSSPGMNEIYEVTPEEVREDATPVFGRLHPDDHDAVAAAIDESARTLNTFYSEFRVVLPRQGLRWRWSQAHPTRMPDGGTLWHGIIIDITERKQAEAERTALEVQLRQAQKMESVGRLAGGVAHDFNNMLAVILGHVELAMEQTDPSQPVHADLSQIQQAAGRSADLTRQLLAFARKQTISPTVLDLNEGLGGTIKMLQRLIGEDIRLEWKPAAGLWPVRVDPSQIDQLLANLCVNARDAITGVGRVSIALENVTFDAEYAALHAGFVPGDFVRIAVSDDGCGMDAETQSHLFEPFFTTKPTGRGTGLGLATVYGIVKQNNGFINVYSEPGEGTTFTIYLPRHAGGGERPATPVKALARGGGETILLVEDEPALLGMATSVLEGLGYTVLTAGSPQDAIRLAGEHAERIRLLVTDVIMPEMNGRELANRIMSRHPHIKHLFMSGYTADVIAKQGVLEHSVLFIQKPFSREALATKIREALGTR